MSKVLTREEAWELLNEYNKEPFHLRHGETVEGVMRYLLCYSWAMATRWISGAMSVCCTIWILNNGLRSTVPRCRS